MLEKLFQSDGTDPTYHQTFVCIPQGMFLGGSSPKQLVKQFVLVFLVANMSAALFHTTFESPYKSLDCFLGKSCSSSQIGVLFLKTETKA